MRVAYVLRGDELYREAGYVPCSRARERTHVYLSGTPELGQGDAEVGHRLRPPPARDPYAALSAALQRSRAQDLALDLHG